MTTEATRSGKERGVLDLSQHGGPVYIGRDRGIAVRSQVGLDSWDDEGIPVDVVVPRSTLMLNSSFFLGLFGPSVQKAGSREAFLVRYHFDCPDWVWERIDSGIERALFENTPLLDR